MVDTILIEISGWMLFSDFELWRYGCIDFLTTYTDLSIEEGDYMKVNVKFGRDDENTLSTLILEVVKLQSSELNEHGDYTTISQVFYHHSL